MHSCLIRKEGCRHRRVRLSSGETLARRCEGEEEEEGVAANEAGGGGREEKEGAGGARGTRGARGGG